jgi:hypothetical protein
VTTPAENVVMPGRNKGVLATKHFFASAMLDANSIVELLSDQT